MRYLFIILLQVFTFNVVAQNKIFLATNNETNKTIVFDHNDRVKILTLNSDTHYGRLVIVDSLTVKIDDLLIPIAKIKFIKKRSLLKNISSTILIIGGAICIISSSFTVLVGMPALTNILVGTGTFATLNGCWLPNSSSRLKNKNNSFQIVNKPI